MSRSRHLTRPRQRLTALLGAVLVAMLAAAPVAAAPQTKTINLTYQGDSTPAYSFDVNGVCDACIPDAIKIVMGSGSWAYGATTTATIDDLHWEAGTQTNQHYDDALLRQGQTLDLHDILTPQGGVIVATGTIKGSAGLLNDPTGGTNWGSSGSSDNIDKTATWTATGCSMPLPGDSPLLCVSNTQDMEVASKTLAASLFGSVDIVLSIQLRLEFRISSDGTIEARKVTFVGGSGSLDRTLTFIGSSPSDLADGFFLPCTQPAGSDVIYHLAGNAYDPTTAMAGRGTLHAGAVVNPLLLPKFEFFGGDLTSINAPTHDAGLSLTGDAGQVTL
ncbi:MAG TPA: hypothetical protein VIM24_11175, partial [Candidatus Limnocylindrales bacterium]